MIRYDKKLSAARACKVSYSYSKCESRSIEFLLSVQDYFNFRKHEVDVFISFTEGPGKLIGYKAMWQRLRKKFRINVKQRTVAHLLLLLDPEGVERRKKGKMKRRSYRVLGPHWLWHIDGYDKLKRFGFAIHGCVDGFSRRVMWLHVASTNNKPEVIAYYYLNLLKEIGFMPTIIRSDRGTENTVIDTIHMALRWHHDDEHAGIESFYKGKSTANERVEKYWRQLRNHSCEWYIRTFKAMQDQNILDVDNALHIQALRFCFGPLIQYDLEEAKDHWNEHRVSRQNLVNLPGVSPMYCSIVRKKTTRVIAKNQ
ncbi:hypothetical protein QAD02_014121 [Eretmocerus hayati]|uniref:Uncharacterized protein n=1 Tax=Eretmocerus hayati TaxID=131215 RepID=A0ACC2P6W7_9HYME|nr:hypothetical protein QAD02_014121 [Eretmocerus hayati]